MSETVKQASNTRKVVDGLKKKTKQSFLCGTEELTQYCGESLIAFLMGASREPFVKTLVKLQLC